MNKFDELNRDMDDIKFSEEEKRDLTERLKTAAEAEMNEEKPKRIHKRGFIVAAAAAAIMSVTAAAVGLSGQSINKYFAGSSLAAETMVPEGLYSINQSQSHNGWTVTLTDCAGDDSNLYIGIDVTAPEGTVLDHENHGYQFDDYDISFGLFDETRCSWGVRDVADDDPTDNKISFIFEITTYEPAQGKTADIMLGDFIDFMDSDSEIIEAVKGYDFKFKNVKLDYTNQTIRLELNIPVEIFSGEATLTKLEISPISVTARVSGGFM
ncbi:MAG: DUF4179 domain-containing protein [Clostridiales bacterium]|nr:DUF4179 domain-containing protein [Clostridiales bacterium]